jgi:group I intron endonuclease
MLGYKHTAEAIEKMKLRFVDKTNHPMYGKNHTLEALSLISKPGALNPMFGKNHTVETRKKISEVMSKNPLALYDLENNLIKTFRNQVELAAEFGVHKTTVSRKVRSGKIFNKKYYVRKLNN